MPDAVLCAVLAVVFDLIACIGDSNAAVYSIFMGLCCAAFSAYVYGLFRVGYTKKEYRKIEAQSEDSCRKAA